MVIPRFTIVASYNSFERCVIAAPYLRFLGRLWRVGGDTRIVS